MKKNKAFTIAELALVLVFIGFISIIALYTVNNRFTDFYSRYTTAYDALSKAIYHIHTDTYCNQDCSEEEKKNGRQFPTDTKELRKRLAEYLNIVSNNNKKNNGPESIKSAKDSEFDDKANTLQLELTNGSRLYFSDKKTITIKGEIISTERASFQLMMQR